MLTSSSDNNFEHNHRDNHTSGKHGLYHKYIERNNCHLYFSATTCDHNLHFNNFAGSTDNNFGRWNNHHDYGWSHSHTGGCH